MVQAWQAMIQAVEMSQAGEIHPGESQAGRYSRRVTDWGDAGWVGLC